MEYTEENIAEYTKLIKLTKVRLLTIIRELDRKAGGVIVLGPNKYWSKEDLAKYTIEFKAEYGVS